MKRTLAIDDDLLAQARRALGTKGVRDTVEAALHEVVRRWRLEELRQSLGNLELDLTSKELARLRDEE